MSSWRYGLIEYDKPDGSKWYEVHELYLNNKHEVHSWTENGVSAGGDTPDEVIEVLEMMIKDVKKYKPFVDAPKKEGTL